MSAKSILRAAIENDELVMRIGIDTLAFAVQQGNGIEPGVEVTDKRAFAAWVADNLIEFDTDESGTSAIESVIDRLAVDAVEGAQTFVAEPREDQSSNVEKQ